MSAVTLPVATQSKRVGFLELFFDLVFVFAVTQLVGLLHADHSLVGWVRVGVVLWLVWWAWSQFAWAGNAIDLDRRGIRLAMLGVTGAMLVAAAALDTAFGSDGLWFAVPYAAVRGLGLGLYWYGLRDQPEHRAALRTYVPIAAISPALVLVGGALGAEARLWCWAAAMVIDVASVLAAGRGEFRIDPGHFAERHGLIVIIALGEAVIAIGATATDVGFDAAEVALLGAGFVVACGLWWCYFDWVHHAAEQRLVGEADARRRGHLARDLFTFGHLPIVAGIVLFAAAIEEALLHPSAALEPFAVASLAASVVLYLGGFVLGNLRATGRVLVARLVGLVVGAAWVAAAGPRTSAIVTVAVLAAVVWAVAGAEWGRASRRE